MTNEFRIKNTHAARITQSQALWARERYAKGDCTQRQIADALGIGIAQVGKILRNEAWKHVQPVRREVTAEDIAGSQARLRALLPPDSAALLAPPPLEESRLGRMEAEISAKRAEDHKADGWLDEIAGSEE